MAEVSGNSVKQISNGRSRVRVVSGFVVTRIANSADAPVTADAVYINGKVFTAGDASPIVEAFAVRDGHFLAVGTSKAMRRYIGKTTTVVDLKRHLVTPGLADGHLHNEGGGQGFDLSTSRSTRRSGNRREERTLWRIDYFERRLA
jgi:hypothetical protein